jgi:uncharacterized protein (DUF433 family)
LTNSFSTNIFYETFELDKEEGELEQKMRYNITIDPQICHGKPCIAHHRIPVYMVLELIAEGFSFEEIIKIYYPSLTKEEIVDCVLYARHLIEPEPITDVEPMEQAV